MLSTISNPVFFKFANGLIIEGNKNISFSFNKDEVSIHSDKGLNLTVPNDLWLTFIKK